MMGATGQQLIPGYQAERLFDNIERFRRSWPRFHRPDDVNQLLRLFPHVSLPRGYKLDYLPMGSGATGWIWPYARPGDSGHIGPPPALAGLARDELFTKRGSGELRRLEVETLYRHLSYENSAQGLFEYALLISELWATKSASRADEWLGYQPLLTRRAFEAVLRRESSGLRRVARPDNYDPRVIWSVTGGGQVLFMVYQGGAWKRISMLGCLVDADGYVRHEIGELIANLG
jgi:hypothetical protein